LLHLSSVLLFFFFQAEDGIRDFHVTGVQTCALPILLRDVAQLGRAPGLGPGGRMFKSCHPDHIELSLINEFSLMSFCVMYLCHRSEERRVGKECSSWWVADD